MCLSIGKLETSPWKVKRVRTPDTRLKKVLYAIISIGLSQDALALSRVNNVRWESYVPAYI